MPIYFGYFAHVSAFYLVFTRVFLVFPRVIYFFSLFLVFLVFFCGFLRVSVFSLVFCGFPHQFAASTVSAVFLVFYEFSPFFFGFPRIFSAMIIDWANQSSSRVGAYREQPLILKAVKNRIFLIAFKIRGCSL